jgi:hypothetical protein
MRPFFFFSSGFVQVIIYHLNIFVAPACSLRLTVIFTINTPSLFVRVAISCEGKIFAKKKLLCQIQ